jgi:hypothetical protein
MRWRIVRPGGPQGQVKARAEIGRHRRRQAAERAKAGINELAADEDIEIRVTPHRCDLA